MANLYQFQKKLVPELMEKMDERYRIIKGIATLQPVGRRTLAEHLQQTERHIRSETEFLDRQGIIDVTNKGMFITSTGQDILENYYRMMEESSDLSTLEKQLQERLGISHIKIVPGDADATPETKQLLGKEAANILHDQLIDDPIIDVTGGSTMALVAEYMRPLKNSKPLFIPARGGLGDLHEYQANSICVKMADQCEGDYRLLHVPDEMNAELREKMLEQPGVKEIVSLMEQADLLIHGVGDALAMAERRKATEAMKTQLEKSKAVGEAFGYYIDQNGNIIDRVNSIGVSIDLVKKIPTLITVAGGSSKKQAISAFLKWVKSDWLVTDEVVARYLMEQWQTD